MKRLLWALFALSLGLVVCRNVHAQEEPPLARTVRLLLQAEQAAPARQRVEQAGRAVGAVVLSSQPNRVTFALPSGAYEDLLERLRGAGTVQALRAETKDLTTELSNARAAVRALTQRIERLERMSALGATVQDGLLLSRAREQADAELARARGRLLALTRRTERTHVTIEIRGAEGRPIQSVELPFPWLAQLGERPLLNTTPPQEFVLRSFFDAAFLVSVAHIPEKSGGDAYTGSAGGSMRGLGEAVPIGLFGGFDTALGGGAGFLYRLQALGGLGVALGSHTALGVSTGPGIDGITSILPFGVRLPIELYVSVDALELLRASAWVQDGWVFASDERKDGSATAPFGDELAAGLTLAFGERSGSYSQERFGPSLGFTYREANGLTFYEGVLGFSSRFADFSLD